MQIYSLYCEVHDWAASHKLSSSKTFGDSAKATIGLLIFSVPNFHDKGGYKDVKA